MMHGSPASRRISTVGPPRSSVSVMPSAFTGRFAAAIGARGRGRSRSPSSARPEAHDGRVRVPRAVGADLEADLPVLLDVADDRPLPAVAGRSDVVPSVVDAGVVEVDADEEVVALVVPDAKHVAVRDEDQ